MNKAALKSFVEEEIRSYKKAKRRKAKRKECPACGIIYPRHSFSGKRVCPRCHVLWEAGEAERQLSIKENLNYNNYMRRMALEEEKEG